MFNIASDQNKLAHQGVGQIKTDCLKGNGSMGQSPSRVFNL